MRQNILGVPYSNYYDENELFIYLFIFGMANFCPILVSFLDENFPIRQKSPTMGFLLPYFVTFLDDFFFFFGEENPISIVQVVYFYFFFLAKIIW
jgi:hypothetical protein